MVAVTRAQAQAGTPEPEALGLRERRKQRVEAELERIALERFAARGFDAVTVDELAAAADVSRRTFFRYFPSKEDLLFSRRRAQTERLSALLAAEPRGGFDVVRRALLELAREHERARERIVIEHAIVAASPHLTARDLEWDRRAQEAIAEALSRSSAGGAEGRRRARLCAGALVGVVRVVIEDWLAAGARGDLEKQGALALELVAPLAPRER